MFLSHQYNAGQIHVINIANRCFENVAEFKYLGTTVTNQNLIQEEIKRRLNSGKGCYHSAQNHLSSCLLSKKKKKMKICKTIILPVVLYGLETWPLTLKEEGHRLSTSFSKHKVLRRILGPKRAEVMGDWRKCIARSFVTYTLHQI
jgi:hypothetical protein